MRHLLALRNGFEAMENIHYVKGLMLLISQKIFDLCGPSLSCKMVV